MVADQPTFLSLLGGTVLLRPYVFVFLLAFLVAAIRDLGVRHTIGFLVWGWSVAFVAEYASTRVGIPFGLYHYTELTRGAELFISNVPFFDSLSFVFLAYAAYCLARFAMGTARGAGVVALSGVMMMLLDVVVDPLAVRGDRWVLGRVFYYPAGGVYFGVPLSNFGGWLIVGWTIVGGYVAAAGRRDRPSSPGSPGVGVALYYGVLLFNLVTTMWIGAWDLLAAGILVQGAGILLLYRVGKARGRQIPFAERPSPSPDHEFDDTRSGHP